MTQVMGPAERRRWVWITATVAALSAVAIAGAVVLVTRSGDGDGDGNAVPPAGATTAPAATTSSSAQPTEFGFQPLWPFASVADARRWQREYREGGQQPWHLDAELTAQQFAQSYLGYGELDRVVRTKVSGDEAWVDVGYRDPNGKNAAAAVVHLAKIGTGADAPWEVVGTKDSTLSLTTPGYGAMVTSPTKVGGKISGLDESLQISIWRLGSGKVGESPPPGIPAGGQNSPWSTTVPFDAPPGSVLTIAVSTGGHVAEVERFAITGVRVDG